jgi:FkbM family methyltransferase
MFYSFTFNEGFIDILDYHYYDENNNKIDNSVAERDEQDMAILYIEPTDIVLELGARYGTVSVLVSKIVENTGKLVVVEPDPTVINALKNNQKINKADFEILDKIIANSPKKLIFNGYSTFIVDDTECNNCISYNEFKKLYPYNFNTLIADCEGCLEEFINMLDDDLNNYNKIIFEADLPHNCNYDKIIDKLENNGFKLIDKTHNIVDRYYFKRSI